MRSWAHWLTTPNLLKIVKSHYIGFNCIQNAWARFRADLLMERCLECISIKASNMDSKDFKTNSSLIDTNSKADSMIFFELVFGSYS